MGIQINGQTDRITAVDGSFSIQDLAEVNVTGVATASNFKTGTSNVHSTGYECANINATGIVTAASANFTGNVSIGGTLTYQDVTNIDSVGLITARNGIDVTGGNVDIGGATHSRNLSVHDATNGVILIEGSSNGTSNLMFADENDEDVGMLGYNHASNYLAFTVNAAERLRILSTGTVNIGDQGLGSEYLSSTVKIRKDQNSVTRLSLRNENSGSGSASAIQVGAYGNSWMLQCGSAANDSNAFTIRVDGSANSNTGTEKLRITTAGLVGVNCTPLAQFQVKSGTNQNIALSSMSSEASIEAFNDAGSANVPLRLRGQDFKFYTSSTERVRITSDGDVKIKSFGNASNASADALQIGKTDNNYGITILSATNAQGRIDFTDTEDTNDPQGKIAYYHDTNSLRFFTNGGAASNERMHIDSSGHVRMLYQPGVYLDALDWSTSNNYMHNGYQFWQVGNHWNNSTGTFTCPVAGKYLVSADAQTHHASKSGTTYANLIPRKNNADYGLESVGTVASGGTGHHSVVSFSIIMDCAVNDTIRVYSNHSFRSNTQNHLTIYLLG